MSLSDTNGCKESLQRKQLEDHLENDCLKRITKCLYCNEENIYEVIVGDHFKLCTQLPIKCSTEGCDFMTKRCSMGKHKRECPKEVVTCQYNTIGCHHHMKREEQDEHNEQTIKKHLKMAVKEVEHLRAMLVTLESPVKNAVHQQIQLAGFKEKKESDISWYCPPIYTSPGGYKMRFQIFPSFGESKGKKLSCLVRLLPGAYDDILEWPFQGEVTIELLNQLEDRNHIKKEMIYNETTPDVFKTRVVDKEHGEGYGKDIVSLDELNFDDERHCQYLKDDTLYFRMGIKALSSTKEWLVNANFCGPIVIV